MRINKLNETTTLNNTDSLVVDTTDESVKINFSNLKESVLKTENRKIDFEDESILLKKNINETENATSIGINKNGEIEGKTYPREVNGTLQPTTIRMRAFDTEGNAINEFRQTKSEIQLDGKGKAAVKLKNGVAQIVIKADGDIEIKDSASDMISMKDGKVIIDDVDNFSINTHNDQRINLKNGTIEIKQGSGTNISTVTLKGHDTIIEQTVLDPSYEDNNHIKVSKILADGNRIALTQVYRSMKKDEDGNYINHNDGYGLEINEYGVFVTDPYGGSHKI